MISPSSESQEGIRVQLRMLVSALPAVRYDVNGNEILQVRGHVIDASKAHPELVVRFSGQRRAELYRWAKPDKHLGVDGFLEIKQWMSVGKSRVALLVEAVSVFPLGDIEPDLSRVGIYAVRGRVGAPVEQPRTSKEDRAAQMRRLLDKADS